MKKILYFLSFLLILIAPFFGEIQINFQTIFNFEDKLNMVFWDLRVPRVLMAFFVGAILALSGAIFQIVFKNDLENLFPLLSFLHIIVFCHLIMSAGVISDIFLEAK